jgi:hypothetical protein
LISLNDFLQAQSVSIMCELSPIVQGERGTVVCVSIIMVSLFDAFLNGMFVKLMYTSIADSRGGNTGLKLSQ